MFSALYRGCVTMSVTIFKSEANMAIIGKMEIMRTCIYEIIVAFKISSFSNWGQNRKCKDTLMVMY